MKCLSCGSEAPDKASACPTCGTRSAWYVGGSILSLGLVLGLGVYGFYVSPAGQPLFRDEIFAAER